MTKLLLYGWKVVEALTRVSAMATTYSPGLTNRVEYPVGKRVFPFKHCGPLAVFTNRWDAKDFAEDYSYWSTNHSKNLIVIKVRYKRSMTYTLWYVTPRGYLQHCTLYEYPSGTDFADFITCLE